MADGFKPNIPQDSEEFEDLETAQSAPAQPVPKSQQQVQPKVQESFDVKDEVGKAIESAQQSVFGPTDPAKIQQQQMEQARKKQDDQKKIGNIKQFLNQMAQDEQRNRQLKQQEEQKKMQTQQIEQEKNQDTEIKQQKKEESFVQEHIKAEQSKAERKLGVGG